jgi:assimilatory nitrate reductase catalytic subunit
MSALGRALARFGAGPEAATPLTDRLARADAPFGLGQVPADRVPTETRRLVCGFCSTGCGLDVHLRDGRAVGLTPSPTHPVNRGGACPKGWEALAPLAAPDRATTPLARDRHGHLVPVTWDQALELFCRRFKASQAVHGPASAAFLSTGQIATEEMALLGAVAKFGMGMRHGDGNTRQCMASAVVAYKESFGFDAPPYSYDDLEASDVIVLVGSNLCVAHPILWDRITRNPHGPEIVVIDPRRTETADRATLHLAPRPKTDLALLYGLARALIERGTVDRTFVTRHTLGFEAFAEFVATFTPERVAAETGVGIGQLHHLADVIAAGADVSFWWTMGVNQSHQGVRTAQALIDLALLTGNIGRAGTGANSITGQCNAMGSRLFSNTTSLLGGRDFADPAHRAEVAAILELDEARIPDGPSLAYDRIVEGIATGEIRSLWVVATNGAHSWINNGELRELLGRLDFLVVQDLYPTTETAQLADLVLPAAGWGEKDGTFINSERRLGRISRVVDPPGQARTDFEIFRAVADAWAAATCSSGGPTPRPPSRSSRSCRPVARATSPGSRATTTSRPAGSSGRWRRAPSHRPGCSPTGASSPPTGGPASCSRNRPRPASGRRAATPWPCSPGGARPPSGTPAPAPRSRPPCGPWPPGGCGWTSTPTTPPLGAWPTATTSWSSRPGARCAPGPT